MLRTKKAAATTGTCLWNLARLNALMMSMMGGSASSRWGPLELKDRLHAKLWLSCEPCL